MRAEPLLSTARAAGKADELLHIFARETDWSNLPRDGILQMLADMAREAGREQVRAMDRSALIQAQEARE
jgi:hypothetical protein